MAFQLGFQRFGEFARLRGQCLQADEPVELADRTRDGGRLEEIDVSAGDARLGRRKARSHCAMLAPRALDVVQRELDERGGAGPLSREPQAGDLLIQLLARQFQIAVEQDFGQGGVGRLPGIEFIHPALDQRSPRRILGEERVEERGRLLCVRMSVRRLQDLEIDLKQESRQLVLDLGRGLREIRKVAVQELPVSARFGSGRAR